MEHSEAALPEKQIAQFHWPAPTPASAEDKYFGRMLVQVIVGSALLMSALCMIPKPKPNAEELVPPQFAKLLLKPTVKKEATTKESKSIESTRERNVVRAFESKALQKTVKNVLNLGQISGLSKSALVGGLGSAGAAAKVFNSKAPANPFKGLDNSLLAGSGPKVDPLGGGKYKGSDVVAINGQGNHQLAFDASAVEVADGLDKDQVGKTIRGHVGEIRYCYEAALVRNPSLEGKLVVTFIIAANGTVKTATNKQTNADAGLVKCILDHLKKWSFPKPVGGMEVEVSYPFIFKSIGG
jgi:outer membrane biosynthesis protein TonB